MSKWSFCSRDLKLSNFFLGKKVYFVLRSNRRLKLFNFDVKKGKIILRKFEANFLSRVPEEFEVSSSLFIQNARRNFFVSKLYKQNFFVHSAENLCVNKLLNSNSFAVEKVSSEWEEFEIWMEDLFPNFQLYFQNFWKFKSAVDKYFWTPNSRGGKLSKLSKLSKSLNFSKLSKFQTFPNF